MTTLTLNGKQFSQLCAYYGELLEDDDLVTLTVLGKGVVSAFCIYADGTRGATRNFTP